MSLKIAIIGSGVSGLVAAHLLHARHRVSVYEAEDRVGGHVHSIPVRIDGRDYPADVGFVVYNRRTYPEFSALLARLGVETIATEMSFSVRAERAGIEYNGGSLAGLFSRPSNAVRPAFLRLLADILRFNREARRLGGDSDEPLGEYLGRRCYSRGFREWYLLPMLACIWSAPGRDVEQFPLGPLVVFLANHGLLDLAGRPTWRVVAGGASRYVETLVRPFRDRLRLRSPVYRVERCERCVRVHTASGAVEEYDEAVVAVHGDRVLDLLGDASERENELFSTVRYVENEVVLHMDESLLPERSRTRACWNAVVGSAPDDRVTVTYDMNRLQRLGAPRSICVSLNPVREIAPETIVRRLRYRHPLLDPDALKRKTRIQALCGRDRIHFCGAYLGYGFHEDGVASAIAVAKGIEARHG